ncbi:flavoprotein [Methanococcus maripaludis]|uniref:Coenzyme A biosynthesis bifunctional protein CoaBC n=2 Tax=Methanococcus maripaludis TaxID=39152 RepID=A0A2L1CA66_METMI|nr:flavoprotein [Methanococcus maripaludis]AVB76268.1 Coenzyme A biosynthesis bifunctional protein CoaBC [Methanococcus maripaludis]MBA2864690.1 phosphopantothenoylcysteine synthetase/decarboxylase [Methanococcus maripaludis]MBB6497540.1 phosphopantothenoylcysteine synthetase/decarboxylase [Methanococcus maripaludis]
MFKDKNIVVGICACSPAIKTLDLIGQLRERGAEVDVIMTPNSVNFVSPLMVQREAKRPVQIEAFELPKMYDPNHKSLSQKADLLILAPVSANTLGKAANGIADNLLATTIMSTKAPIVAAMHINPMMYSNPAVQRNIKQLKEDGFIFVDNGNEETPSKFPEISQIMSTVEQALNQK